MSATYLVCPLCGKLAHLNAFTPDEYSDDIEVVEMRGLGRGKGFAVTARFSALDDEELMDMISSRCRAILKMTGEDVALTADDLEKWRKEALWQREVEQDLRDRIAVLEKSADENEEIMDGLLAEVNGVLEDIYEGEFGNLESAVAALIVEYNEALEEAEDTGADAEEY